MSSALLCHARRIPRSTALLTKSLIISQAGPSSPSNDAGSRRHRTTTVSVSRMSPSRIAFLQRERGAYAGSSDATLKLRTGYVKPRVHTPSIAPPKALPPPEQLWSSTSDLLVQQAPAWAESLKTRKTLSSIGIPTSDIPAVLHAFLTAVKDRSALDPKYWDVLRLQALWEDIASKDPSQVSLALSRVLFAFPSMPSSTSYTSSIPESTLTRIQTLHSAADTSHPEERFERARRMRRSFIMHVGPTNSGKTHHALRALAAAESGVYAGPLRLLAHEIFTRLNAGQIVPAGIDVATLPPYTEPDTNTNFDVDEKAPVVRKDGDPRFVRPCNMITGEEQRIVDDRAPLLASTIEMLGHSRRVNVAVIDEIQLIGDAQRGGAWTDAVLGLCADEIHLCGEESAVPIVERLLADTGDKLEIRRYQRLTPLVVAEKSLNEDFSKIEKGDCVVGFSRSAIFKLKNRIEKATGLRCAMAYGALPPEIRSEQAALFNDPDSGYDVLVGTDAIGMGLNLKIKRIVLESTVKFNGQKEEPLSISQIKQIAGRAGRYGLHKDNEAGGICTTLREEDMPRLRAAIAAPQTVLSHARLADATDRLTSVFEALPAGSPLSTVLKAYEHICAPRAPYRRTEDASKDDIVKMLDEYGRGFDMNELVHLLRAPIQARDPRIADGVAGFLRAYGTDMRVYLRRALGPSGLLVHLKEVHETMRNDKRAEATMEIMMPLESLHRLVTLYLWCAFRNPVIWADAEDALVLKNETEEAMTWALARMASEGGHRAMPTIRRGGKWAQIVGNRLSGSNGRHKRAL